MVTLGGFSVETSLARVLFRFTTQTVTCSVVDTHTIPSENEKLVLLVQPKGGRADLGS